MEKNLRQNIEFLKEKKDELETIKKKIDGKRIDFEKTVEEERKKFEDSLKPLKESSNKVSEEFNLLAKNRVSVSLEDLVKELSNLTGISVFETGIKFKTDVGYWGRHNIKKMLELMDSENQRLNCMGGNHDRNYYWELRLFANKNEHPYEMDKQSFCFEMLFRLNLDEIQADGKTLLEHCTAEIRYDEMQGSHYTVLVINKNIGDIILNLRLDCLVKEDSRERFNRWYPADLLTQAIINCVERKKEENQQTPSSIFKGKIKSRKIKLSPLK